jgi:aldose 1-epimerase
MSFETIITEESGHSVITLVDATGGCEAEIYTFGGLLNAFRVLSKKESVNLVDGFSSVNNAKENITNGFKSTKLSPFVCRMQKGKYNFRGQDLTIQKYFLAGHAIHGLIYDAAFKIIHREADHEKAGVTLEYQYEGTDKGYPFPYRMIIHWQLETGNKLTVATTVSQWQMDGIHILRWADRWMNGYYSSTAIHNWNMMLTCYQPVKNLRTNVSGMEVLYKILCWIILLNWIVMYNPNVCYRTMHSG